jgi:hypothetical protein
VCHERSSTAPQSNPACAVKFKVEESAAAGAFVDLTVRKGAGLAGKSRPLSRRSPAAPNARTRTCSSRMATSGA